MQTRFRPPPRMACRHGHLVLVINDRENQRVAFDVMLAPLDIDVVSVRSDVKACALCCARRLR